MKYTTKIPMVFIIALALLGVPAYAATDYASSVESFTQGLRNNGSAVLPARSDAGKALGPEDGDFVSLGFGGELVLKFPTLVGSSLTVTVLETTFASYPAERANVYVSEDNVSWTFIGTADNSVSQPNNIPHPSVFDLGDSCIQYVKLVDATDGGLHDPTADAFDVDAASADYTDACERRAHGDDTVINDNEAYVGNVVMAGANTGGNDAGGSYGGNGGRGGDIRNSGDDVDDSTTGNGGNGGSGDVGGTIYTGNANANAGAINDVNSNDTEINRCGECDVEDGDVVVVNTNRAMVRNGVGAMANTGENGADGSYGGEGGNGGDIDNNDGDDVDDSTTGDGGTGGPGGPGALIQTGHANANAGVINVVNRNLTRILR